MHFSIFNRFSFLFHPFFHSCCFRYACQYRYFLPFLFPSFTCLILHSFLVYIYIYVYTGCSLNIVFFSLKCCNFSELCHLCCSAGVLPAWCVYTHGHRGKTEKGKSPEYVKILRKNTIFNEHPVYKYIYILHL